MQAIATREVQKDNRCTAAIKKMARYNRLLDVNALNVKLLERPIYLPDWATEEMREVEIRAAYLNPAGMICIALWMTIGDVILPHQWMPDEAELQAIFSLLHLPLRSIQ